MARHEDFGSCQWPIWQIDDFSLCFQVEYVLSASHHRMIDHSKTPILIRTP